MPLWKGNKKIINENSLGTSEQSKGMLPNNIENTEKSNITIEQNESEMVEKKQEAPLSPVEKREINRNVWKKTDLDFLSYADSKTKLCTMKKIGVSHISKGMPCQDNFALFCEKKYSILAIADGHGSQKHDLSEYGSKIACESLVEVTKDILSKKQQNTIAIKELCGLKFKTSVIDRWKCNVKNHFLTNFENFDEENTYTRYGTTLLFVIDLETAFVVGQLGDGGIIISNGNEYYLKHREDEKVGTSTASMCSEDAYMHMSIKIYDKKDFSQIMLMTDGMYDIFSEDKYLYANFDSFIEILNKTDHQSQAFNEKYNAFVEWMNDDATVALLYTNPTKGLDRHVVEGIDNNSEYTIVDEIYNTICKNYIIQKENINYLMIAGDFAIDKKVHAFPTTQEKTQIANPADFCKIGNKIGLIFNIDHTKFITLDRYFEYLIKKKKKKSDIVVFFRIAYNLLQLVDELTEREQFYNEELFRELFRINIETGECVLLWYTESKKNWQNKYQKNIKHIIVDYLFDLLLSTRYGTLNILDDSDRYLINTILQKNIYDRVSEKLSNMFISMKKGEVIDFDLFRRYINEELRTLVNCSCCKNSFILSTETCQCPFCDEPIDIIGTFNYHIGETETYTVPIATGIEYTSNNFGYSKFKSIASVIKKSTSNEYGLKNYSGISWEAYDEAENKIEVPNGTVKGLDNTKRLKIKYYL